MEAARPPPARLRLLGGCRLTLADGGDATPRSAKGKAMLAYLALAPGGRAERGRLAGLFWSESADAKASLRQCLKELRRTLGQGGLPDLVIDGAGVAVDLGSLAVDVLEVDRLAREGRQVEPASLGDLRGGELLEGVEARDPEFEIWLLTERARVRRQCCRVLERTIEAGLAESAFDGLRATAEALLALEPAHEAAHRALMRCHAARGDPNGAARQYQLCKAVLERELGVAPCAETEALLQELRRPAPRPLRAEPPPASPIRLARRSPHASIVVEPRPVLGSEAVDQAVLSALASGVREVLSRTRWLSVMEATPLLLVAPSGALLPASEPRYGVGLSLLRLRDRMRVQVELKDGEARRIIWAGHYDRAFDDELFTTIDEVTAALASSLERELELAEIMRAQRKPVEALSAYDYVLRAMPLIFRLTPDSFREAGQLLIAGQQADPDEALVYAWRSFWYFLCIGQGWAGDLATARAELGWLVARAIELDSKNALALAVAGHIASFVEHDYERALQLFDLSLGLDPSSAYAWDLSALTQCYTGNALEGLRQLEGSQELWKRHPNPYYFRTSACIALMLAGQDERAVELGRRTVRENPGFQAPYRPLIASLGQTGRIEEAQAYLARLRELQPEFSVEWMRASYPPLEEGSRTRYVEGLRKAGVPEA